MYFSNIAGCSYSGEFQPLSKSEEIVKSGLYTHIDLIAGKIGERNIWSPENLRTCADYITKTLDTLGYKMEKQVFQANEVDVFNIEAEKKGVTLPDEIIIIGAHYDTIMGIPGANDNTSGVAGMLEIARILSKRKFSRTLRFVAFMNEEPPFFKTDQMGSYVYADNCRNEHENIVAMFSLETIGYYSEEKGSQKYPAPLNFFYPNKGNFIGFVSNIASRKLLVQSLSYFREHTRFPSQGLVAPYWLTGVDWSDHQSFWKKGYPAVMITDTALFRYHHYHTEDDTPDKIDYTRTARVVYGLSKLMANLADAVD